MSIYAKACPDCRYLIEERAAIHQFDGKATKESAEKMSQNERCSQHQEPTWKQANLIPSTN